jgi:hypothetical protein
LGLKFAYYVGPSLVIGLVIGFLWWSWQAFAWTTSLMLLATFLLVINGLYPSSG